MQNGIPTEKEVRAHQRATGQGLHHDQRGNILCSAQPQGIRSRGGTSRGDDQDPGHQQVNILQEQEGDRGERGLGIEGKKRACL